MSILNKLKLWVNDYIETARKHKKIYQESYDKEYDEQLKLKAKRDVRTKMNPNKKSNGYGSKVMENFAKPYFDKSSFSDVGKQNEKESTFSIKGD